MAAFEWHLHGWRARIAHPLVRPLVIVVAVVAFGLGQVAARDGFARSNAHPVIASAAPRTAQAGASLGTTWPLPPVVSHAPMKLALATPSNAAASTHSADPAAAAPRWKSDDHHKKSGNGRNHQPRVVAGNALATGLNQMWQGNQQHGGD